MGPGGFRREETLLAFGYALIRNLCGNDFRGLASRRRTPGGKLRRGWRQLYGDFDKLGVSVEWHDFQTARSLDWGRSFHPHSMEFCLNLNGRGEVGESRAHAERLLCRATSGYYAMTDEPLSRRPVKRTIIINS